MVCVSVKENMECLHSCQIRFDNNFGPNLYRFQKKRNNGREKCQSQSSDFLTYSRETWFPYSYGKVEELIWLIEASDETGMVSKFNNSLSFGAKQNAPQIFFVL